MKSLFYFLPFLFIIASASCKKKDDDLNKELGTNNWSFTVIRPNQRTTVYDLKNLELNTQIFGRIGIKSKSAISGGLGSGGDACDVEFFFKTIPLASNVYKITTLDRIDEHDDEVAIFVRVSGDPGLADKNNSAWSSVGDGSQTLDYKFVNGKCSFNIKDIKIHCESNYPNEQDALFSANIVQP